MSWTTLIFYIIINVVVFFLYGIDKRKAIKNKWRIPESTLLFGAVLGVFGAYFGMKIFHHKTQKIKFTVTVPIIMIIETGLFAYIWIKFFLF